ncbi:rho GTPase-activating protein 8 [Sorex fumeus]|uniref:rho GTPase-activating protein 8 n=1 Tax=Sorex fumeus TaxID=62283 RepID=UPI0024AE179A|nr:rho GTPase-activating protein 8 [Sorex fumeus]
MSQLELEELAEIELQREEEEAALLGTAYGPSETPAVAEEQLALSTDHPFYDVARHGFLQVAGQDRCGQRVVTFSCCRLPPSHQLDHRRLLKYLEHELALHGGREYALVYFHHGLHRGNRPSLRWLQSAYGQLQHRYRKNLKALYVVHPSNSLRVLWALLKPLVSHKFGKKITYVHSLRELQEQFPGLQLTVPPEVRRYDEALQNLHQGRPPPPAKTPPPRPPLPTQQFGVSLQYLRDKNQGELIPPVLRFTVTYLREKGLHTKGLFRKPASIQSVREVQRLYNQGKRVDLDAYGDVHVAAATLKAFLRELPQPLLTDEVLEQILGITGVASSLRVTRCRQIAQSLPEHNHAVLSYLVGFLHEVSRESLTNGMSSSSLARVFALNLLWRGSAELDALVPLLLFTELLIEHPGKVFRAPGAGGEDAGGPTRLPAPTVPPRPLRPALAQGLIAATLRGNCTWPVSALGRCPVWRGSEDSQASMDGDVRAFIDQAGSGDGKKRLWGSPPMAEVCRQLERDHAEEEVLLVVSNQI